MAKYNLLFRVRDIIVIACLSALCVKLGAYMVSPNSLSSILGLNAGVMLAVILLKGYYVAPAVFLGSFAAMLPLCAVFAQAHPLTIPSWMLAASVAIGVCLQNIVAAWLVQQYTRAPWHFLYVKQTLILWLLGGLVASLIATSVTTLALFLAQADKAQDILVHWVAGWLGDALGVFVLTPMILMGAQKNTLIPLPRKILISIPLLIFLFSSLWLYHYAKQEQHEILKTSLIIESQEVGFNLAQRFREIEYKSQDVDRFLGALESVTPAEFNEISQLVLQSDESLLAFEWISTDQATERIYRYPLEWRNILLNAEQSRNLNKIAIELTDHTDDFQISQLMHYNGQSTMIAAKKIENRHSGIVMTAIDMRQLILPIEPMLLSFNLQLQVEDQETRALIYASPSVVGSNVDSALLSHQQTLFLGQRALFLTISSYKPFIHSFAHQMINVFLYDSRHEYMAPITLVLGFFLSLLMLLIITATGWHAAAEQMVKTRTGSLELTLQVLHRQAEELTQEKLKAEASAFSRSQFLASMSHEIRTPMNAILGFSQLLLKSVLTSEQTEKLKRIHSASGHLLGIINDILDFSKIEAGKMSLESIRFSLRNEMNKVRDIFQQQAIEKGIGFYFFYQNNPPDNFMGDPLRLRQIVTNLMSNAIKFTENGFVKVIFSFDEISATLSMVVQDTGIGISPQQQKKLFSPFSQADGSISRKFGGTGLGLSISKYLAELMGGEISITSEPNIGSQFLVQLKMLAIDHLLEPELIECFLKIKEKKIALFLSQQEKVTVVSHYLDNMQCRYELIDSIQAMQAAAFNLCIIEEKTLVNFKESKINLPVLLISKHTKDSLISSLQKQAVSVQYILETPFSDTQFYHALIALFDLGQNSQNQTIKQEALDEYVPLVGKCLLVDDNENNQILATALLEEWRLTVKVANNGLEAVQILKEDSFDIVLMDMQMPIMDGLEATQHIRHDLKLEVPILAMTANAMESDKEQCRQAGMNSHIAKPIDSNDLYQKLKLYLPVNTGKNIQIISESKIEKKETVLGGKGPLGDKGLLDSQDSLAESSDFPGIEVEPALQRLAGKQKLYHKVLANFCEEYSDIVSVLREALAKKDTETAIRIAHTLKGVAGTVGAEITQKQAGLVESTLKSALKDGTSLEGLEVEMQLLQKALSVAQESAKRILKNTAS